jgi:hypothetical protein
LDYDRARRETKGGKNCKVGAFVGGKLIRMVPFPLSPVDAVTSSQPVVAQSSDLTFLKELVLKMVENHATAPPAPPAPTLTDLTAALSNLDNLRGKPDSAMDNFKAGLEFARGLDGSTDWKTDALRTVRDIAPQVLGAIDRFKGGGEAITTTENGGREPLQQLPPESVIKAGLVYLKKKCIAGVESEFVMDWILNNAEEYEAIIRVVLNQEFSYFINLDPEIGSEPFATWFTILFNGLRQSFSGQDPMDEHPAGDTGNGGHARDNGKPSESGSAKPKSN